jgi:hypothetical protein
VDERMLERKGPPEDIRDIGEISTFSWKSDEAGHEDGRYTFINCEKAKFLDCSLAQRLR